jgi:predicted secreted Zn-dependent protease
METRLKADGLTNWRVDWRFTVAPTSSGCRCASFSTTTKITVTLPRWTAPTNVVESTKVRWEHYIHALGQHEAGHAQLAQAAGAELHKRIKALGEQPDCDGLKSKINELGQTVLDDFRKREKERRAH